jgi:hypothetical protein
VHVQIVQKKNFVFRKATMPSPGLSTRMPQKAAFPSARMESSLQKFGWEVNERCNCFYLVDEFALSAVIFKRTLQHCGFHPNALRVCFFAGFCKYLSRLIVASIFFFETYSRQPNTFGIGYFLPQVRMNMFC